MNKLTVKLIGTDEPSLELNITPPNNQAKNTVTVEDTIVTDKLPSPGDKVEIDRDVLETLLTLAKDKKNGSSSDINDKLSKAIDRLAEATAEGNDTMDRRFLGARPVDFVQVDKSDIMENNGFVIFFAKSVSFAVYDDKRNGFTIKPPYNRSFKFKTIQRIIDKTSQRNPTYLSLSAVIIRSKKEAQWLREHSLFGIKFHEQKDGGKDISEDLQDKIVQAWGIVTTLDDHTVMQRCIGEGIQVDTSDITKLRKRLSLKIATNMSRDEEKIRRRPVKDYEDIINGTVKSPEETQSTVAVNTY